MKFLRLPEVIDRTGLSRSGVYRRVAEGVFPAPVKLGVRAIGWLEVEVAAWQESRPRARFTKPPVPQEANSANFRRKRAA